MKIGKNMRQALDFAKQYPGWHSYRWRDRAVRDAIRRLVALKLVEHNQHHQFRAVN